MNIPELLKLLKESYIYEMAQKQGVQDKFTFYTLDNEYISHYPHVHVCVKNDEKRWNGKALRNGSPYKTVASVRLRKDCNYTSYNLEFEEILDSKIENTKYIKTICNWLNSRELLFDGSEDTKTNGFRCLQDYLRNNEESKHIEEYK